MRRVRLLMITAALASGVLALGLGGLQGCGASADEPSAEPSASGSPGTEPDDETQGETEGTPTSAAASDEGGQAAPDPGQDTQGTPTRSFGPPRAGERVSIPAGTLHVGSRPGTRYRNPHQEADLDPIEVPAFQIDRLPYPNDPAEPPRTQVSRPQAQALCAERGQRLCTELEWERACKGDTSLAYVTGESFVADACADDYAQCTSPVGVSGLGVRVAEWTATSAPRAMRADAATWIARGASADSDEANHRCGARRVLDPNAPNLRVGFRCCEGPEPELDYPAHASHETHELVEADDATLASYLRQMPEVARYADGFHGFTSSAAEDVLSQAEKTEEDLAGWRPFTGVLRWTPTEGEHVWVFAGSNATESLIVIAHPMPDGSLVHGASFVFEGETPPVLVAYSPGTPNALKWSTCWDCAGEGGVIMMRDGRVTIAQR